MLIGAVIVLYIACTLKVPSNGHEHGMRGPHHPRGKVVSHHHYRPQRPTEQDRMGKAPKLTQDSELLHDVDHIREDLGEWVPESIMLDTQKMTPEELEFHYFKLHDFDNNTKLDGLEILQAIHHTVHYNEEHNEEKNEDHDQQPDTEKEKVENKNTQQDDFNYFVELIDQVLEQDDLDKDGYLSYIEYVVGRQKDEHKIQSKYNKP